MKTAKRLTVCVLLLVCLAGTAGAEQLEDSVLLSFYNDSAFFGDSNMYLFRAYINELRKEDETVLAGTSIYCTSNMTLYDGSRPGLIGRYRFSYRGEDETMYTIARLVRAKKVFILLGINDPVGIEIDKALSWVEEIVREMNRWLPETEIYFFSHTPVGWKYVAEKRPEYPELADEYNRRLQETCTRIGARYIEIAEALKGEDNLLNPDYTTDGICHLNPEGISVWIQCMKDYAQEQYDLGLWDPPGKETETEE